MKIMRDMDIEKSHHNNNERHGYYKGKGKWDA